MFYSKQFINIAGLRILVMLLLDTLPMLGNVLMLCFFVFFIFGIIAVQLWAGNLRNRCYLNSTALGHITIAELVLLNHSSQDSTQVELYFRICTHLWAFFPWGSVKIVPLLCKDNCRSARICPDVQRFFGQYFQEYFFRSFCGNNVLNFWASSTN